MPVGVGMPGAISPATGLVKNANSTWLNGRRFSTDLGAALGRPVRVANDADCFALSEAADGAAAGAATVFGVIIGTGIGGGVVVDQRLSRGRNAIAGEWGHNPLPWPRDDERPGPACYCGRAGCIETFLSGPGCGEGSRRAAGPRRGRPADAAAIAARAAAGDALAESMMVRYEDRLARGLASIINVLDPRRHRARRRPVEPGPPLRPTSRRAGRHGCSAIASTPGWSRRGTATRAACAARRGCGDGVNLERTVSVFRTVDRYRPYLAAPCGWPAAPGAVDPTGPRASRRGCGSRPG